VTNRRRFQRYATVALAAALIALGPAARAEEALLRGPYPFRNQNELGVRGGFALGLGDTPGGTQAIVDYGYRLDGGLWLNLEGGFLSGRCGGGLTFGRTCGVRTGNVADVLGGIKWKLAMDVPLVPYGKIAAGLFYLFPDEGKSGMGVGLRGGIGATYFLYEWLGVSLEAQIAAGRVSRDAADDVSPALGTIGLTLGAELAF